MTLSDKAQVSLLTNAPWDKEVYTLFGHTAIRVSDSERGIDVAFNFGIFDFNSPNFIYRFVRGKTDYLVAPFDYKNYVSGYQKRGVAITEQVLNLEHEEKESIYNALLVNIMPENRIYRYNYFYDNCSTRPRDIIINNIKGSIKYSSADNKSSFRDLLKVYLQNHPWVEFGIDLVIGADADQTVSETQKNFLPIDLENSFNNAIIYEESGKTRNLVLDTQNLNVLTNDDNTNQANIGVLNSPLLVGYLLMTITIAVTYFSFTNNNFFVARLYDTLLFFVAGTAGSLIFFLMFFSEHPCTYPNWNIAWLNPLQLVFAGLFFIKSLIKYIYCYHLINFVILCFFLVTWLWIPQQLNLAFIPYIVSLAIRSGINSIEYRKLKKQSHNFVS